MSQNSGYHKQQNISASDSALLSVGEGRIGGENILCRREGGWKMVIIDSTKKLPTGRAWLLLTSAINN